MDTRTELVDVIRQVRNRWRLRLALRGAVVVVAGSVLALAALGLRPGSRSASAPPRSSRSASSSSSCSSRWSRSGSAAAATPGHRRAGRAVSRGVRPDARSRPHQRGRGEQRRGSRRPDAFARAGRTTGRAGDREVPRGRYHRTHRAKTPSGSTWRRWPASRLSRRCWSCSDPAFLRNGLSALLIVYRSTEASTPYRIEVTPGNTNVPRGSDQQIKAKLFGFKSTDAEVMDAQRLRTARSIACRSCPTSRPARVRGHAVPPREADRLLRRVRTACDRQAVHDDARRPADRLEARARIPLPRLHRPAAAEDRERRRRRRAARHRSRSCTSCRR